MEISIERLLDMPVMRVLSSDLNEREISIQVEFSQHHSIGHKCGQKATESVRAGEPLRLRHPPIFNRPVSLYLRPNRYRCLNGEDPPTTTPHGDWYDSDAHCTKAFAESLLLEMLNSPRRRWPANTDFRTTSCVACLIVTSTPRLIGRSSTNYATSGS